MADRFYGVAVGGTQPVNVTEAASTTSAAIELRINDAAYSNKIAVLGALEAVKNYLQAKENNPIG